MKPLLPLLLFLTVPVAAPASLNTITVTGGKADEENVVCKVALPPGSEARGSLLLQSANGASITAEVVDPGILDPNDKTHYLVFVLPKLKAGETITLTPQTTEPKGPQFKFVEDKGKHLDLLYGDRSVLRFINAPHDPANHFLTFKPFHQVFDPAEGKTLLTTGAVASSKEGLYPHHRGLFFGFNKVSYGNKQTADIWHGTDNVFSQQDKLLSMEAGPVLGRHAASISWHGKPAPEAKPSAPAAKPTAGAKEGATFATEERQVTVYHVTGGTLIDWSTIVSTKLPEVKLDGDPQHAGFHFRAAQEVAAKIQAEQDMAKKEKRAAKPADTYYLRPDGKGAPGDTRNWDPKAAASGKADARTINLPWDAMSFVLGGKRYTVLRIDDPNNPKESRGSERDYGRFGDYFEYTLTPDKPLRLRYRVWVQEGEMTVDQCKAMAAAFVHPPEVKLAARN